MTTYLLNSRLAPADFSVGLSCRETTARKPGGFFVGQINRRSNASALATSNAGFLASVSSPEGVVEPLLQAGGSDGTHRLGKR